MMFRPEESTNIDIYGIDKAELLVALFNNAKKSNWTRLTIGKRICSDEFFLVDFDSEIQETISQMILSKEEAESMFNSLKYKYIDYIKSVGIKIDFSQDSINVNEYNKMHRDVLSAQEVIISLQSKQSYLSCAIL